MSDDHMTHDEAREALEALSIDVLDAGGCSAVLAHAEGCDECRAELDAMRRVGGELSYAVRPVEMAAEQRDRLRARLVARAAADRVHVHVHDHQAPPSFQILVPHGTEAPQHIHLPRSWMQTPSSWLAMVACAVAVASVTLLRQANSERDTIAAAYQLATSNERLSGAGTVDSLHTVIADRDKMIRSLTGPNVAVVTLAANGSPSMSARMFWDQALNEWTFIAHNLPRPRSGRTYQLWLVTANQKISAGTFTPTAAGDALVRATYSLPRTALAAVAVTDEPAEGSSQPTTTPFILGTASTR